MDRAFAAARKQHRFVPAFERVFLPLDGSERAERAIGPAVALARGAGALVWPVSAADSGNASGRERYLARTVRGFGTPYVEPEVLDGGDTTESIASLVLTYARLTGRVVACMSTHARAPLPELLLGSTAAELVRFGVVPIVLVGPDAAPDGWAPKRLIVCLDGSKTSEAILPVAASWAVTMALPCSLVRVGESERDPAGSLDTDYLHHHVENLRSAAIEATWDVLHARNPAGAIADYAGGIDGALIAMTTHGWSGVRQVILGSVVTDVVRASEVPVLVSRPWQPETDTLASVG